MKIRWTRQTDVLTVNMRWVKVFVQWNDRAQVILMTHCIHKDLLLEQAHFLFQLGLGTGGLMKVTLL